MASCRVLGPIDLFTGFGEIKPALQAICDTWGAAMACDLAERPDVLVTLGRVNDIGSLIDRAMLEQARRDQIPVEQALDLGGVLSVFTMHAGELEFRKEMLSWLQVRISVEEVDRQLGSHPEWKALKDAMRSRDELWEFSSPPESWQGLCGRAGIACVRDGRIFATIVLAMN
jgi:hypothetical protein